MTKEENEMAVEVTAKLEMALQDAAHVASLIAGQATVISVAAALLRDEYGVGIAELRERVVAFAEAAGGDLAASVPQIIAILPDEGAPVLQPN